MNTKENVISRLSTGLNRERLAYKIMGIALLVTSIILIIIGMITLIGGIGLTAYESIDSAELYSYDINGEEYVFTEDEAAAFAGVGVIFFGGFYFGLGGGLLAVGIVNLVMASKIGKYRLNPELTVKHAGSVGSIVVAALFNEIALIFVIINFVFAKRNRAVLEEN